MKFGKLLRERRVQMGLTQKQLGGLVSMRRENIRDVELEKRNFCTKNFRKVLKATNMTAKDLLERVV